MNDQIVFKFHNDPGHAWLEVKIAMIKQLKVSGISSCSYIDRTGVVAFLEEDCDAGLFIDAFKLAHPTTGIAFNERYSNHFHWIRQLPRYMECVL